MRCLVDSNGQVGLIAVPPCIQLLRPSTLSLQAANGPSIKTSLGPWPLRVFMISLVSLSIFGIDSAPAFAIVNNVKKSVAFESHVFTKKATVLAPLVNDTPGTSFFHFDELSVIIAP